MDYSNLLLLPSSSFREYVDCSESVVYNRCGLETALFTRKFMHQMTLPMIKEYCETTDKGHECEFRKAAGNGTTTTHHWVMSLPMGILIWLAMLVKTSLLI